MAKAIVLSEKEFHDYVMYDLIELFVADIKAGCANEEDFIDYAMNMVEEWIEIEKVDMIVVLGEGYDLGKEYKEILDGRDLLNFVKWYYGKTLDELLKERLEEVEKFEKR